jgi:prepilin peptidase CpaA
MNLFQTIAVGIVVTAVGWDLSTRRIPNALTIGATLAGIVLHGVFPESGGSGVALAGWMVGTVVFFPIFALGGMGAGDVKLLGAIGAFLGPGAVAWVALYSGVAGGLLALFVAVSTGYLGKAYTNLWCLLMFWRVRGVRPAPELMLASHQGPRLAYALPMFAGLLVTLWLR